MMEVPRSPPLSGSFSDLQEKDPNINDLHDFNQELMDYFKDFRKKQEESYTKLSQDMNELKNHLMEIKSTTNNLSMEQKITNLYTENMKLKNELLEEKVKNAELGLAALKEQILDKEKQAVLEKRPIITRVANTRHVKFTYILTEPLEIGSRIICTGTPGEDLPWFAINVGNGDVSSSDIAVHFNVRMAELVVVRNTQEDGVWGREERTRRGLFPFKFGRPFTIEVLINEKDSVWTVDGMHFCNYRHRYPSPLTATCVQITGVRYATMQIQKSDKYPNLEAPLLDTQIPDVRQFDSDDEEADSCGISYNMQWNA